MFVWSERLLTEFPLLCDAIVIVVLVHSAHADIAFGAWHQSRRSADPSEREKLQADAIITFVFHVTQTFWCRVKREKMVEDSVKKIAMRN